MDLYHGTGKNIVDKIKKPSDFRMCIPQLTYNVTADNTKKPGSLGYGLYTFQDDLQLAKKFADKSFNGKGTVLKIDVNVQRDEMLDLTKSEEINKFRHILESGKNTENAKRIFDKLKSRDLKQDVYAGVATELVIGFAKSKGEIINFVRKRTETHFDKYKYRLGIPNGIEVTIRKKSSIVNFEEI